MNTITLFHRSDRADRGGECDVASVPVFAIADGSPCGYIGAAWGEHVPVDVIDYAMCLPAELDAILFGWGIERKFSVPDFGGSNA